MVRILIIHSLDPMDLFLLLGIGGMSMILVGFFLIQTHRVTADSLTFDLLNAVGSSLLVIYGISGRTWPFVILNAVLALYSFWDIARHDLNYRKNKEQRKDHTTKSNKQ